MLKYGQIFEEITNLLIQRYKPKWLDHPHQPPWVEDLLPRDTTIVEVSMTPTFLTKPSTLGFVSRELRHQSRFSSTLFLKILPKWNVSLM